MALNSIKGSISILTIGTLAVKILSTALTQLNLSNASTKLPSTPINSNFELLSNPVIPISISLVGSDKPVAQEPKIRKSTSFAAYRVLRTC